MTSEELAEVRAERDELPGAERVFERTSDQLAHARASAAQAPGQAGGRAVMLIPHRAPDLEEATLPPDSPRILAAVRQAAGAGMVRLVREMPGVVRASITSSRPGSTSAIESLAAGAS
ncbi:hypothetical protein [Streptomyces sp. NBC_01443]|uniref:hypothetical protein n=1 Tax=Streptomyces sp. NBC_01443 TaxID=2903868 RepID=UPI00224F0C8C|nr:hypothetical protein [Streptomyces sp. NBC_01443]MCX4632248.1 hypothetical protein [Streptomyces sp. NBC_01443]